MDTRAEFETRVALDFAIAEYEEHIRVARLSDDVNIDVLERAVTAQNALERLLPLRDSTQLPSLEELTDQISVLVQQRDLARRASNFTKAKELQERIDVMNYKIQKEEDAKRALLHSSQQRAEKSLTNADINYIEVGRDMLRRIMTDVTADPEPLPLEYIESCTDKFSDEKILGVGACGQVYEGIDTVLRRKFAVKRLEVKIFTESRIEHAKKTFEREILTLQHFRHPNICRLYGYFLSPDHQCLVFELAANGSLYDFLVQPKRRERLHWTARVNIALDVAKALEYLHDGNPGRICYHRDVKSANVCLKRNFTALLIDYGISKIILGDESNAMMTIMKTPGYAVHGTPGYICPTFAHTLRNYTSASEVFSLGIVLVELFTGVTKWSEVNGVPVDHFSRYGNEGVEKRPLEEDADVSARKWRDDVRREFVRLAVECISLNPGVRPPIQHMVDRLGKLASLARPWSPGERN